MNSKVYLLDTSIIIDAVENILTLSDNGRNKIIITDVVLNETDHLKSSLGNVGYMARRFNNFLQDSILVNVEKFDNHTISLMQNNEIEIHLISQMHYEESFHNNYQSVVNDRRIIETALWCNEKFDSLIVVSNDVAFRTYAMSKALNVESLIVSEHSLDDIVLVKTVEVTFEYLEKLHLLSIQILENNLNITIDESCKNIIFQQNNSDYQVLANIINNKIELLDEEKLRQSKLPPKNREQLFYANLIQHPGIDIVLSSSPSGSGKTAIALANAMKLIDAPQRIYQKIIYIRNPIDSVDKDAYIGFKKGDLDAKMDGYFTPIYDALENFATLELRKSKKEMNREVIEQKVSDYIKRYNIDFPYIGNLRGSNLNDSIIIIDEAQNFSLSSMQLVLTRITDGSKVIVIGDINQVDSIYLSKRNNALTFLIHQMQNRNNNVKMAAISMSKSIRGNICEWAETIFSQHK
jgi:PhoH-like ATPase